MKPFVFRAARALDLRRRREEAERAGRAHAAAAVAQSEAALAALEAALDETFVRAAGPHPPHVLQWYRNWIARQHAEIERQRHSVAARRAELEAATRRVHDAHRDVRVLERLEARGRAAWQQTARRNEQKDMDWLGTIGHVIRVESRKEDR